MPISKQIRKSIFRPSVGTTAALVLAIVLVLADLAVPAAQAQAFNVIHNFSNGTDGRSPTAGMTINRGNLYGTAVNGGRGCGTGFQLKQRESGWTFGPLYSFLVAPPDYGCDTEARVIFGPNGTLFGTTYAGGGAGYGAVFNLRPSPTACSAALCPWMETVLYDFAGSPDGAGPGYGDLLFDQGEGHLTRRRFGVMLGRIAQLPIPTR